MPMKELMRSSVPDEGSITVHSIPRRLFYDGAITTDYFKETESQRYQNGFFPSQKKQNNSNKNTQMSAEDVNTLQFINPMKPLLRQFQQNGVTNLFLLTLLQLMAERQLHFYTVPFLSEIAANWNLY